MTAVDPGLIELYTARGFWGSEALADVIRRNARVDPTGVAFVEGTDRMTWAEYDQRSDRIAAALIAAGFRPGERIGVQLPDGPGVHVAFVGAEKAGIPVIGFGVRSGRKETKHLLTKGAAVGLISEAEVKGEPTSAVYRELVAAGLPMRRHLLMPDLERSAPDPGDYLAEIERRRIGPNDIYMLNSTSGTTGLPKMVTQFQNRWFAYHQMAVDAGELTPDDVFMCLIPAPYGFAQWTGKFTPTLLGAPTTLMSRFDAAACLEAIERDRVTVLMCVSTQFIKVLNSPEFARRDLSSLRIMFTGGEAIPYDRAAEFEEQTGAKVLQFFGSNETGALSYTTVRQDLDERLRTCGEVIPFMQVRLFDDDGLDVTATGGPGQPACKGPVTSLGYFDDDDANAELFTEDGWMLTGDICVLEGRSLRLVGRKADFIIRGGKNISAAAVEEEVGSHPAVGLVAAVPMPNEVYGERVACYIVLKGEARLSLDELTEHLKERGASRETWPEHLILVESLPTSPGGKVAKAQLKLDLQQRLEIEGAVGR